MIGDVVILCALFFCLWGPLRRRPGLTFFVFLVGYSVMRFLVTYLRVDSAGTVVPGTVSNAQFSADGTKLAAAGGTAAKSGESPALARWLAANPGETISAREVSEAAAAGDGAAQAILARADLAIGRAVAGMVNIFNPERIIIGGSYAEARWEEISARILREIAEHAFKVPGSRVRIYPAELGGDVSLAGCHPVVVGRLGSPEWERAVAASRNGGRG